MPHVDHDTFHCVTGDRCIAYDPVDKVPAAASPREPLCRACAAAYGRDIVLLRYDFLDLAQLQLPTMSQVWDSHRGGSAGPPMPMRGEPEALQAEIVHALCTWEQILRVRQRLSRIGVGAIVGAWHTTKSNPAPRPRTREYSAVQRALGIIGPRIQALAVVPAVVVRPTGVEDDPTEVTGFEALGQLVHLHMRARAMLGRTRRTFWVPGECWQEACAELHRKAVAGGADPKEWLWRSEPLKENDEPPVWCYYCDEPRTEKEYRAYTEMLVWPAKWQAGEAA